jgi:predicted nucleic acid-binding protein
MRIVADTSTLVSGFGWGGPVLSGQVTLVISPALLGELARVLACPKLAAVFDDPQSHAGAFELYVSSCPRTSAIPYPRLSCA